MKLAFSSLPVQGYSGEELRDLALAHEMAVELRLPRDNTIPLAEGLVWSNAGSGVCLFGYDEMQVKNAKALLFRLQEAGIPAMRVFIGNFTRRHDDPRRDIDEAGVVRALQELCEVGPEIWLETHNEYATGKAILPLTEKVNHPRFGVIWDILHPIEDGECPEDTLALLGKHIRHVHIKDAKPNPDPAMHDWYYTPLGEGEMPVAKIISLLQGIGYEGYYSLEWESAWREELKGVCDNPEVLLSNYRAFMEKL